MFFLNEIENYEKLENGIIKQKIVNKIEYNFDYILNGPKKQHRKIALMF